MFRRTQTAKSSAQFEKSQLLLALLHYVYGKSKAGRELLPKTLYSREAKLLAKKLISEYANSMDSDYLPGSPEAETVKELLQESSISIRSAIAAILCERCILGLQAQNLKKLILYSRLDFLQRLPEILSNDSGIQQSEAKILLRLRDSAKQNPAFLTRPGYVLPEQRRRELSTDSFKRLGRSSVNEFAFESEKVR